VGKPGGFRFVARDDGTVIITHAGRHASTLRGGRAAAFLGEVAEGDPQLVMAGWTGNYKRGNERAATEHPRNRGRGQNDRSKKAKSAPPGASDRSLTPRAAAARPPTGRAAWSP
jgi:hypothetical protein